MVVLVRHGSTALNAPGDQERVRGWSDPKLTMKGEFEAQQAAKKLAKVPELKGAPVVTGDLRRARVTAETIAKATGGKVTVDPRLRTWDYGAFTGAPEKKVKRALDHYRKKTPDMPLYGGESFNQFKQRWLGAFKEHAEKLGPNVVFVTSHANILTLKDAMGGGKGEVKPGGTWTFAPATPPARA